MLEWLNGRSLKEGMVGDDLRRLKLRHLLTVVEVARAGSLTRAAAALHVTVPAVSKTLREVRGELGFDPFDIRHGATRLTAQDEVFAAHARASLESLQRGIAEARERAGGSARSVRIAVMPNVALNFLPQVMTELERRQPLDCVEIVSTTSPTALQMLRHGEIDGMLGRLASPADMVGLRFESLYADRIGMVVRRGHPLLRQRSRRIVDILAWPALMPPAGTTARHEIEHALHGAGLDRLPRRIETMAVELPRRLVLTTDAIWFAQLESVAPELAAGRLRLLFPDWELPPTPVGLTLRPGVTPSAGLRAFRDAVRAAAAARTPPHPAPG